MVLEGEHGTNGEVDATIANGTASTTTVAGNLVVTGNDITFGRSGETLQRVAQIRINSTTCDETGNKDLFTLPADIILTAAYLHTKAALGSAGSATVALVTSAGTVDFLQALHGTTPGTAIAFDASPFDGAITANVISQPVFLDNSEAIRATIAGAGLNGGDVTLSVLYILRDS